jgi:twitching motility protein PilT
MMDIVPHFYIDWYMTELQHPSRPSSASPQIPSAQPISASINTSSATQPLSALPTTPIDLEQMRQDASPMTMPSPPARPMGVPPSPIPSPRPNQPPQVPVNARSRASQGPTLEQLVHEAHDKGYSDIHLGVGEPPRFRDRGEISISTHPETTEDIFFSWLREVLTEEQIETFKRTMEFDGATQYEGLARVRINIFISLKGPAMVLRLIPLRILSMEQLALPPVFRDLCHYHKGLILVTGPTGSGKSTTLAAMVDYINNEMPKHIISIEDPVEFVHKSRKCLIKQREVGMHTLKFDNALKAALREDPDIILIGEMRDRETVNTALKAAQTGHLVFGTLHTNSAVKTIERILNLYNPEEQGPMRIQVAESLVGVIAQSLVRTTDGKRAAVHEIMINTDAIRDYIKRGEIDEVESIIPRCNFDGMCTMNQSLQNLYEAGRITEEIAMEASPKPNEMSMILRGRV